MHHWLFRLAGLALLVGVVQPASAETFAIGDRVVLRAENPLGIYVEQVLVPTLRPGNIVILDNLGSHKSKAIRQASYPARTAMIPCNSNRL